MEVRYDIDGGRMRRSQRSGAGIAVCHTTRSGRGYSREPQPGVCRYSSRFWLTWAYDTVFSFRVSRRVRAELVQEAGWAVIVGEGGEGPTGREWAPGDVGVPDNAPAPVLGTGLPLVPSLAEPVPLLSSSSSRRRPSSNSPHRVPHPSHLSSSCITANKHWRAALC